MLNISDVVGRRIVIQCETQLEADLLFEYIADICPTYRRAAQIKARMWERYKSDTVYHIHCLSQSDCDTDYCYTDYYKKRGYEVITYQTLARGSVDLGVFESDGADILSLFNT